MIATGNVSYYILAHLTLRGLSLFFKIVSISNTADSTVYILATVHFLYPKLSSSSDIEYYFYQFAYRDSKVPKHFVGLNQMQRSPSSDWNWGKQNDPTACWHQLRPRFLVYSKVNASGTHQSAWTGSLKPQFAWAAMGLHSLRTTINGGTPPLEFPPYSSCRPKGSRKTINFLGHFHGLVPDTNYEHLESFVMIGTHSEPRRGEMSLTCDISLLRVKNILMMMTYATVNFMFGV